MQDVARQTGSTIQETLQGGQEQGKRGKEGSGYGREETFEGGQGQGKPEKEGSEYEREETFEGGQEQGNRENSGAEYEREENRGGVLKAIGETVIEIAQTTKDIVIGSGETDDNILGFESSQSEEQQQGEARRGQTN